MIISINTIQNDSLFESPTLDCFWLVYQSLKHIIVTHWAWTATELHLYHYHGNNRQNVNMSLVLEIFRYFADIWTYVYIYIYYIYIYIYIFPDWFRESILPVNHRWVNARLLNGGQTQRGRSGGKVLGGGGGGGRCLVSKCLSLFTAPGSHLQQLEGAASCCCFWWPDEAPGVLVGLTSCLTHSCLSIHTLQLTLVG